MTGLGDVIARLREAAGAGGPDGPLDTGSDEHLVAPERESGMLTARPAGRLTLGDLEEVLGTVRRLPRNPAGGDRTVLFVDTLPADGESGVTVLAEVDEEDGVSRLLLRPDSF